MFDDVNKVIDSKYIYVSIMLINVTMCVMFSRIMYIFNTYYVLG